MLGGSSCCGSATGGAKNTKIKVSQVFKAKLSLIEPLIAMAP